MSRVNETAGSLDYFYPILAPTSTRCDVGSFAEVTCRRVGLDDV